MQANSQQETGAATARILAVIVLYKQLPEQSQSLLTLQAAMRAQSSGALAVSIQIADNTPGGQEPGTLPGDVRYVAYPANPGLAQPYNEALTRANAEGFQWLLTLDQDTNLPASFLTELKLAMDRFGADARLSAIVPRILDGGRQISPFRFGGGFLPLMYGQNVDGLLGRHASAINSASLHRVQVLTAIGGFDSNFALHNSDTDVFQRLDHAGKRIAVAKNLVVEHEFSMRNRSSRMSPERYRQNLEDECRFWDLRMSGMGRLERLGRLMLRAGKGVLSRENGAIQAVTLREIQRRLLTSRRRRLQQ